MTLGDRFLDAEVTMIDHEGRPVHSMVALDIAGRCTITVRRLGHRRDRVQSLNLAIADGSLQVNGVHADQLTLRTDTSPDRLVLIAAPNRPTTLHVWNGWLADGIHHAWVGNAGIEHEIDGTLHTLRCSDGIGRVTFDDLIVSLAVSTP